MKPKQTKAEDQVQKEEPQLEQDAQHKAAADTGETERVADTAAEAAEYQVITEAVYVAGIRVPENKKLLLNEAQAETPLRNGEIKKDRSNIQNQAK